MLVVGLTGGIASGKSTVSAAFARLGVPVVDTDLLAREVVTPGSPGLQAVVAAFGEDLLTKDGQLDRARLRARVFTDEAARQRLNAILHPRIRDLARQRLAALRAPYALLVVPLLIESGMAEMVDQVLVVDCPESTQLQRLQQRDGVSEALARNMLAAQASRQQRLQQADAVIDNSADLASLRLEVNRLDQRFRHHGCIGVND